MTGTVTRGGWAVGTLDAMGEGPGFRDAMHCLVKIPKGSRNEYEWDDALGGIELDRFLYSSVHYPTDYKQPEGKEVVIDGWQERDPALRIIEESRARRREKRS